MPRIQKLTKFSLKCLSFAQTPAAALSPSHHPPPTNVSPASLFLNFLSFHLRISIFSRFYFKTTFPCFTSFPYSPLFPLPPPSCPPLSVTFRITLHPRLSLSPPRRRLRASNFSSFGFLSLNLLPFDTSEPN